MWWLALALAGPRPADPVEARLAGPLREALRAVEAGRAGDARLPRAGPLQPDGVRVVLEPEGADLAAAVEAAGWAVEARSGGRVQVWVPWEELRALAALPGVARVREPWLARPKGVITEGWDATMTTDWHARGITGAGVRVGVVDVGFVGAAALAGDELPDDVRTDFSRGNVDATDHGTAVAEVIHDFAPDATLFLASFSTDVEFGEVMELFVDEGVDVINGSIGFDNVWHADGTSSLTVYSDWAVQQGAAYFAAAGNENDKYVVGELEYADGEALSIGGVTELWFYAPRGEAVVSLRWSEPFGEAAQDVDLAVYDRSGTLCGVSEDYQDGTGWPYEEVVADCDDDRVFAVAYSPGGVADVRGLEAYLYAPYGVEEELWTDTEDLTLPGDTVGGISVGAYYPADDSVAWYSSRGPTNDDRIKPDVVAPTGVSTTTYGPAGFEGSSAATPHAAGLGALWVQATGASRRPEKLREWMLDGARDLGDPGKDNLSGRGAVEAGAIPDRVGCGCAQGGGRPGGWVLVLGLWAWSRRSSR